MILILLNYVSCRIITKTLDEISLPSEVSPLPQTTAASSPATISPSRRFYPIGPRSVRWGPAPAAGDCPSRTVSCGTSHPVPQANEKEKVP